MFSWGVCGKNTGPVSHDVITTVRGQGYLFGALADKFARHFLPLSLRVRFLLATAGVVLVLSLACMALVALVGYSVKILIKPPFVCCWQKATCLYPRQMENNKISVSTA